MTRTFTNPSKDEFDGHIFGIQPAYNAVITGIQSQQGTVVVAGKRALSIYDV